jgi:hypothetical protein
MIGLFRFVLAVLASPFKSKVRLEALPTRPARPFGLRPAASDGGPTGPALRLSRPPPHPFGGFRTYDIGRRSLLGPRMFSEHKPYTMGKMFPKQRETNR